MPATSPHVPRDKAAANRATAWIAPAVRSGGGGSGSRAWMVSFTDLIALMLTFFVMLFAMSQVEQGKWQSLLDVLAKDRNDLRQAEQAKPAAEVQIEQAGMIPGTDLDYLAPVLRQHMATNEILVGSVMRRLPDRVVISLPGDLLYEPGSSALRRRAEAAIFAIGEILGNLDNTVEVAAHTDPSPPGPGFASNWELSLARAVILTRMLTETGYRGPVVARGFGDSRHGRLSADLTEAQRRSLGSRIDVVIHERAKAAVR
ncbi:MAG: flagellar motor protein MotB [Kiloniellaceae bacterium]